jgi:peptidyl-prolyl cis-trans isomerase C
MKLRLLACAIALFPLATLAAGEPAAKQDPIVPLVKIDDFNLTNMHFSVFAAQHGEQAQSRAQQIRLLNELVNTFMVAHSAKGRELAQNPELKAAMEVANARLLARAVIRDLMDHTEISDDQVEKMYQEKYAGARHEYKARHILLKSEDEAKAVIKELQQGADFQKLAKDKSTGPSASVGGDLGWFTPDSMVKPFAEAVAAMKDGEYTKTPVKTRFGWHVILREDSRELPARTLDEVRDEIVDDLKTEKLSAYIQGLRDKTDIQVVGADAAVVK